MTQLPPQPTHLVGAVNAQYDGRFDRNANSGHGVVACSEPTGYREEQRQSGRPSPHPKTPSGECTPTAKYAPTSTNVPGARLNWRKRQ